MKTLYNDVLYLLACAANGEKADKNRIEAMDLDALYTLCKEHKITALISSVLAEHIKTDPEQYAKWQQEQMKALYRDLNFAAERAKILAYLEKTGIWHMPLKGIVLKDYYPKPELREFADNDILFDEKFAEQVEQYMLGEGYQRKQSDSGHVMEYEKEPCFNFEMHRSLYHSNNPAFYNYYKDVKNRLLKDDKNQYGYHFSDEDFYVFMVSHIYRHYRDNGVGIRNLLDIYIYNKALADGLNYVYIEAELDKMESAAFEKQMRQLAQTAFGSDMPAFDAQQEQVLQYYFASGAFGSLKTMMSNKMKKTIGQTDFSAKGRRKYWFKRLFDLETYKHDYPRAYKTGIAIPFLIFYRCLRGLTKAGRLKAENERLKQMEQ